MDALTQARSDAEFAGRTESHEWQTKGNLAAQAWALIAIAERLEVIAYVLGTANGVPDPRLAEREAS